MPFHPLECSLAGSFFSQATMVLNRGAFDTPIHPLSSHSSIYSIHPLSSHSSIYFVRPSIAYFELLFISSCLFWGVVFITTRMAYSSPFWLVCVGPGTLSALFLVSPSQCTMIIIKLVKKQS